MYLIQTTVTALRERKAFETRRGAADEAEHLIGLRLVGTRSTYPRIQAPSGASGAVLTKVLSEQTMERNHNDTQEVLL